MKLQDLKLDSVDAQIVKDWLAVPNGRFVTFEYIKWDKRVKAGYDPKTKQGGAHIISVYTGMNKGVAFENFKKVQASLETVGDFNNPSRQNEVEIDDVPMLFYNTKTQQPKFMAVGGVIRKVAEQTRYMIPDNGLYKQVSETEYNAYLNGLGLSTTPKVYDNKRGVMVNQYILKNIVKFNGIVYRIIK